MGRLQYAATISGTETIDVSRWAAGVYFAHWASRPDQTETLVVQ